MITIMTINSTITLIITISTSYITSTVTISANVILTIGTSAPARAEPIAVTANLRTI